MNSRVKFVRTWLTGLIAVMLVGCAGKQTRIDGYQYIRVDDPGGPKNISLVLASYSACDDEDSRCRENLPQINRLQTRLESCIERGLQRTGPHTTLIKQSDWAQYGNLANLIARLAAGEAVDVSTMSAGENGLELHYLVSLGVTKSRSDRNFKVDIGGASGGRMAGPLVIPPTVLWGFGQEWTNTASLETRVYSAETGVLAADLTASLSKDAFWMVPVITVVPLIPIGSSPNVEATTCTEMGEALGRFFSGAGNEFIE